MFHSCQGKISPVAAEKPAAGRGVPMVVRSVRSACDSGRFDFVGVSSDDQTILTLAEGAGAVPLQRDAALCGDDVRAKDVVWEHLREMDRRFDYVALFMNTNPFRTAEHAREAFDLIVARGARTLVSVNEFENSPGLAMKIQKGRLRHYYNKNMDWLRESEFPVGYCLNGAIFIGQYDYFMENRTFLEDGTVPYIMDRMGS